MTTDVINPATGQLGARPTPEDAVGISMDESEEFADLAGDVKTEPGSSPSAVRASAVAAADRAEASSLRALIWDNAAADTRKLAANSIALAASLQSNEKIIEALALALKNEKDEPTKIAIARAHLRCTKSVESREALRANVGWT